MILNPLAVFAPGSHGVRLSFPGNMYSRLVSFFPPPIVPPLIRRGTALLFFQKPPEEFLTLDQHFFLCP